MTCNRGNPDPVNVTSTTLGNEPSPPNANENLVSTPDGRNLTGEEIADVGMEDADGGMSTTPSHRGKPLRQLKFVKLPAAVSDDLRGRKRQRVDHGTNPNDEANTVARSLSDFSPSPAAESPSPAAKTPKRTTENPPDEVAAEAAATKAVIQRLLDQKAKKATKAELITNPGPLTTSPPTAATYTPTPEDGFLPIHPRTSTHVFENIAENQQLDWLNLTSTRLFIQPLMHGYYPADIAQEIASRLKEAIENMLDIPNVKVAPPIADVTPPAADCAPFTYLVHNISTNTYNRLLEQHIWISPKIGFVVYSSKTTMPSYLGALKGINITDNQDVTMFRDFVLDIFWRGEVAQLLAEMSERDSIFPEMDAESRVANILKTFTVRPIEVKTKGSGTVTWINLYLDFPTESDDDWSLLVDAVLKTKLEHSLLGAGIYDRGWTCHVCHGADHPTGLCPFPNVPGWFQPIPITPVVEYRAKLNSNNARGGGHRGRGGARGNNARGNKGSRGRGTHTHNSDRR
ncbi:hypothetical protein PILCRDRAFT_750177 [Piloderma croceum F 1598]|uniref:Uncharacterized protein n=1 Tax=Piloderma croceum (strain F 1598) TaxID=765440 RepID=A0A0C3B371_PILCF|nr:hypothetical protein PILCRDRAFT_750177 [Piloderma croceum F 1598]